MRKITHPLALLRFLLGKTQSQFGKELGVSAGYIKMIESRERKRKMSPHLWLITKGLYGWGSECQRMPLADPKDAAAVGRQILMQWRLLEAWRSNSDADNADAPASFEKRFAPAIRNLIEKAQSPGKKRAVALLVSLENWMSEASRDFGLGAFKPIYSSGWGGRVRHSSGGIVSRLGSAAVPMPDHIRKAVQPYFDAMNRAKVPATTPKRTKAGKRAGGAKRSRKGAA